MTEKAVVDRFEGTKVVILVGQTRDRYVIEKTLLPAGVKEGDWLKAEIQDDHVFSVQFDREETSLAADRISNKLDQLRKR